MASALILFPITLPIILSAIIFTVSLVFFFKAKGQPELRAKRKVFLIVSSVVLGVIVLAYVGIVILFSLAIRNM